MPALPFSQATFPLYLAPMVILRALGCHEAETRRILSAITQDRSAPDEEEEKD